MQGPDSTKYTLKNGHGFRLGNGRSVWSNIHVADLGRLICLLVDAAVEGIDGLWNGDGIYLPESGQMVGGLATQYASAYLGSSHLVSSLRSLPKRHIDKASLKVPVPT